MQKKSQKMNLKLIGTKVQKILAKINGLNPNPGAWFKYKNERYKVWKAKIANINGMLENSRYKLTVACKDKSITILRDSKKGKK